MNATKPDNGASPDSAAIDELTWPAGFIRVRHMLPGDSNRDFYNRRDRIEPTDRSNPVFAFEDETQITQSWVTSVASAEQNSTQPAKAIYQVKPAFAIQAELGIKAAPNPNVPIAVITFGNGRDPPPELSEQVGFGTASIYITSEAVAADGNQLRISTKAAMSKSPEGAHYSFPGIIALQRTEPKTVGDPNDAAKFVDAYREAAQSPTSQREWNISLTLASRGNGNFIVYRVFEPVTVSSGETTRCYLIATYSPIPVGFTLQDCWPRK